MFINWFNITLLSNTMTNNTYLHFELYFNYCAHDNLWLLDVLDNIKCINDADTSTYSIYNYK